VYNLAGPLKLAPQIFNSGVSDLLQDIVNEYSENVAKFEHVTHYDFTGGPRDLLVPA